MNNRAIMVLHLLSKCDYKNQRDLATKVGCSLGTINKTLKYLERDGYLSDKKKITEKGILECNKSSPKNAIILAAGYGLRMVPINFTTPKALLKVNGEPLIERLITQLKAVGIDKITVVVGFMKESFEYLIDKYGLELVVNSEYGKKNNLFSLTQVMDKLSNSYIVPSDIWCKENPFSKFESHSWYMVSDLVDNDSDVRVNRKLELVKVKKGIAGNSMIGIAYLADKDAEFVKEKLRKMSSTNYFDNSFWEEALYKNGKMIIPAKLQHVYEVTEINTYEQLRELDSNSTHLKSKALSIISRVLGVMEEDISDIKVLKKGMTNRSFVFKVDNTKYIMRIPGEGTDQLINRIQENDVYHTISGKGLCDDPIYINPNNGYKITRFLEEVRVCDPKNESDLKKCMKRLRSFHDMNLKVAHTFDVFNQIEFYESLWGGIPSAYNDYYHTKECVFELKGYIDNIEKHWCLTHVDAVPDNFLFYRNQDGFEDLQLTDWEYAGMQDPHMDLAMFSIYSMYDRSEVDKLIDIYFEDNCDIYTRIKIYAYISICGLLWSNWCEYKRNLGIEFGEYSLRQYRFAKEYYRLATQEMEKYKK